MKKTSSALATQWTYTFRPLHHHRLGIALVKAALDSAKAVALHVPLRRGDLCQTRIPIVLLIDSVKAAGILFQRRRGDFRQTGNVTVLLIDSAKAIGILLRREDLCQTSYAIVLLLPNSSPTTSQSSP